ncbi:hypothetical protein H0H92_009199 [Tricholoma furcatifolium]|nr:hypothetical protein H0H92_009199 [Tricholoma furcatifolium]
MDSKNETCSLPEPVVDQAYCNVSALEGGLLDLQLAHYTTSITSSESITAPSLAFLLRHSRKNDNFLFDLGMRKDWNTYSPTLVQLIAAFAKPDVSQDVVDSLAKGGLSPSDISTICLSHLHFDHVGDASLFPDSIFLLGENGKCILNPEHNDPSTIHLPVPLERIQWLSSVGWQPLGPFPRALDFYGDGSLYIVDAAGHLAGHLNILARTSADGSWIYLAADSAHHWDLVTGKGKIAVHEGQEGFLRCAYSDKEEAEKHLVRIRELLAMPRVRVLLSHDIPWYSANNKGAAFWPGKIPAL